MSKKKKHRKTRKQKNVQKKNISSNIQSTKSEVSKDSKQSKRTKSFNSNSSKLNTTPNWQEEESIKYFRHDVRRSLTLIAAILVVFGILYFLLDKTSFGAQVYSIIKF